METQLNKLRGIVTIKRGKVTFLKNVTDLQTAFIGNGDPDTVLKTLADAGWKLEGDYELKIYKNID